MTGQDACGPQCWVALPREVGGVLVAVGPVGERHRADLLGLALAEGFGIERVGTARLLGRDGAARTAPRAAVRPGPWEGGRMPASGVSVELIVCTACELAKPAEAFYTVRGPRSVGD